MDLVPLPRKTTLFMDGGYWILSWDEHAIGLGEAVPNAQPNRTRIGSATGSNALTEIEARRQARRYLLSRLPSRTLAQRSQMTLAEFIGQRYLPELLAVKKLPWRAHYHSILKHILSPEDSERILGNESPARGSRARHAHWPYLGQLCLRDIRPFHADQLIHAALERGYSPQTVRNIRSLLSAVFTYARQELCFTGVNPTCKVKLPTIGEKSGRQLTAEQLQQVLGAMRYPEKQITLIRLNTDMNVSEICGLRWKQVNLTGSWSNSEGELIPPITISVRKRWYRGALADVKQTRLRNIPIPEALLPMLLLLRARTSFHRPEDYVLTSRTGTAINVSNITARRLGAISRTLGIPQLTLQTLHRSQALLNGGFGGLLQHTADVTRVSDPLQ